MLEISDEIGSPHYREDSVSVAKALKQFATGDSEGWSVSSLSTSLLIGEEQERIKALSELNRENLKRLIQEVILCAYHWKATVRIAAYKALTHADPSDISQVIRDALSDHDGEARRVAVQIFGNREK